jgi:hypothetical protein
MKTIITLIALLVLSACSEPPKHQIVFTHDDTCKIIINDLQFGQANDTERPCAIETDANTKEKFITINFLSETCNAYRYSFKQAKENSEGVYVFKPEQNEPNMGCQFIPQYSDPNTQWVLNPK